MSSEFNKEFNDNFENSDKQDSVRPISFDYYIGQTNIKDNLKIAIGAAKKRGHQLDHILFYGPPGLGKTTLSSIIAHELKSNIKIITGNSIDKAGDLAAILLGIEDGDVLFIDEIHRIPKVAEELIYSAMEDFKLHIPVGEGQQMKVVQIDLPKFTLIGATTRSGMLSKPLRDRFGMNFRLSFYNDLEISEILLNASKKLQIDLHNDASLLIASRSRKTPRIGLKILKRIRDFADSKDSEITLNIAKDSFDILKIYEFGLDSTDINYIKLLEEYKKPISVKTISSKISEDIQTIEESIENYLLEINLIEITSRGRILTDKGIKLSQSLNN